MPSGVSLFSTKICHTHRMLTFGTMPFVQHYTPEG